MLSGPAHSAFLSLQVCTPLPPLEFLTEDWPALGTGWKLPVSEPLELRVLGSGELEQKESRALLGSNFQISEPLLARQQLLASQICAGSRDVQAPF